jgi:hypothetical protein
MGLSAFLEKVRGTSAGVWHGDASGWRAKHRPYEIARLAGLDPPAGKLVAVTPELAAQVFAHLRSESLLHGRKRYRESHLAECRQWLSELGEAAKFFSNSSFDGWFQTSGGPAVWGFTPFTSFDVDTGIIGVSENSTLGFAFWVGENS